MPGIISSRDLPGTPSWFSGQKSILVQTGSAFRIVSGGVLGLQAPPGMPASTHARTIASSSAETRPLGGIGCSPPSIRSIES